MFERVLVANRGEIAVRIIRTLRRMGIRSVAIASLADRRGLPVRLADDRVLLEGYTAAETYLDIEKVLAAARHARCEAIHPGYGFLSERADFAEACAAAGIAFVGPPGDILRAFADKAAARRLAVANGVPVAPGWDGDDDGSTLLREAARIGFPVMIKARGGGGGRGMREVFAPEELPGALESARREALSAFGEEGLLLEKLITGAHHVEVQVLADTHGNAVHLGERDCSVQRRHQKLIEETPSPVVGPELRAALTSAALRLACAAGYVNAGTFEFLVGEPGPGGEREFYFLEVNPRLQVEHPVTELVTGLDLVELQLRVAAGEPLPLAQEDVRFEGHAIEFRINAEDPLDEFRPSSGPIRAVEWPGGGARVDAGYESGDTVPAMYDSLLGKVVVAGDSRAAAIAGAREAMENTTIAGPKTNVLLHRAVLERPEFLAGTAGVRWLEDSLEGLLEAAQAPLEGWAAAAAFLLAEARWIGAGSTACWLSDEATVRLASATPAGGEALRVAIDRPAGPEEAVVRPGPGDSLLLVEWPGGETLQVGVERVEAGVRCTSSGRRWLFTPVPPPAVPRRTEATETGASQVLAPLAGTVAAVVVKEGDVVAPGQLLVVIEAMKMEHRVTAPGPGAVRSLRVRERDVVREGDPLLELGQP
jgi:acetyl/propionyl-CoA carboxylase alpha subunit